MKVGVPNFWASSTTDKPAISVRMEDMGNFHYVFEIHRWRQTFAPLEHYNHLAISFVDKQTGIDVRGRSVGKGA